VRKIVLLILPALVACTGLFRADEDDRVVARANDKELRISEVAEKIPDGLPSRDSITLAENYISKWIQNEILTRKAKETLKSDELDFDKQLEEYRNSLLLFSLEQKLVSQYLDTVITQQEIEAYYIENRSQFELKGNIVKFDFVKINKRSRHAREFRNLLKADKDESMMRLAEYAEKNATDYWFAGEWVSFNDLLDEMPLEVDNQELFLRRNSYAEATDSLFLYFVRINDFKTSDSISPLEFEKDKIRNIILNARKIDLIERKRQEFIDQAFKDDKAKIF
jgi:hypothetical protein